MNRKGLACAFAHAPPAQPPHHFLILYLKRHNCRHGPPIIGQHRLEAKRLANGARVAIQQQPLLGVGRFDSTPQEPIHQRIGNQMPALKVLCNFAAHRTAVLHFGAQPLPGGNDGDAICFYQPFGNGAFSGTRRAKQHNIRWGFYRSGHNHAFARKTERRHYTPHRSVAYRRAGCPEASGNAIMAVHPPYHLHVQNTQ